MRRYTAQFGAVAVTASVDHFEIINPTDQTLILEEIHITQETEAGDAASEQLRWAIKRATGTYTSGSGGSTTTPAPQGFGDVASGVTAETNNTTKAVAGTGALTTLWQQAENVHNGLHYVAKQGAEFEFSPGHAIVVTLESTPADPITFSGTITVCEVGG